ncbi:metallophosphoesterase family protein [Clostridium rectalis]|uniref:metallophosphoesterase family protein n=1 Tax=Clostridium rectalis TaxID=2040295 RepID=UPI000F62E0BB|nr:DNA repair exonuclease [Clostridium rectalis]
MGIKFKFIHTSDIHLGNVLHTCGSYYKEEFNKAPYNTLKYIFSYAIKNQIDFILISGDVFHSNGRSVLVDKYFYDVCKSIYPIKVYIVCGNHDPFQHKMNLFSHPENLYIFSSDKTECKEFYKDSKLVCRIIGQSYERVMENRKIFKEYEKFAVIDGVYNISMLHTQMEESKSNYVPCSITDLKKIKSVNYWALGHIHKFNILMDEERVISYCGTPQGFDFKDQGIKGVNVIEVDENLKAKVKFLCTSSVIWNKLNLNLWDENIENIFDIENLLLIKIEMYIDSIKYRELKGIKVINEISKIYILKIIVYGIDNEFLNDKEEDIEKYIKDNLNDNLFNKNIKAYIEDICIIGCNKKRYKEFKEHNIYKKIEYFFNLCHYNEKLKKEIKRSLGKIWSQENLGMVHENRFLLTEEDYKLILEKAFKSIEGKFLEGSD